MAQVLLLDPVTTKKELIDQVKLTEILSCKTTNICKAKRKKSYNRKIKMYLLPPDIQPKEITKILSEFKIEDEIWRNCIGTSDKVKISNYGRVAKIKPNGELMIYQPMLKKSDRIVQVRVPSDEGCRKHIYLARHVASVFLNGNEPIPKDKVVIHKNGNKWDNSVRNLEIVDREQTKMFAKLAGNNKYIAKINPWTKEIVDVYFSYYEAARMNSISHTCIRESVKNDSIPIYGRFQWKEITQDEYYELREQLFILRESI